MRVVLALCIGAVIGFGAGWLAFDPPWGTHAKSDEAVAREVLKRASGDNESASCRRRQYPTNVYDCQVIPASHVIIVRYRVVVADDGSVRLGRSYIAP